ncbi:MAG: phosphatidate cytidylyltransferase [Alphaproteobacteria bacterium]|nr:phosphatidate cytidylyltransferase [Alphaproteobacteria bacterium]
MLTRIISGLVLVAITAVAIIYSATSFTVFALIMMSIGIYELLTMQEGAYVTKTLGAIYLILGSLALIFLRSKSICLLVFPIAVVMACDSFAYFTGIKFGKHKLAPKISPKKTWEGAIGGLIAGVIIGTLIIHEQDHFPIIGGIILSLQCGILSILGDLLESSVKRKAGVKDSGKIIPGHGGILDRIDGLIPVAILVFVWFATLDIMCLF